MRPSSGAETLKGPQVLTMTKAIDYRTFLRPGMGALRRQIVHYNQRDCELR